MAAALSSIDWRVSPGLVDYAEAMAAMDARVAAIRAGTAPELVWLLEHPPVVTAGTSADEAELLAPGRFPVHRAGRGGRFTYHGPGQRVGYLMLDLETRGRDIRRFVHALEAWLIDALGRLNVPARAEPGRIGIWVDRPDGIEAKIGAIGVRVRRWVTLHGFALNIRPDLSHFEAIVPCGLAEFPVASLASLGQANTMDEVDAALRAGFPMFLERVAAQPFAS